MSASQRIPVSDARAMIRLVHEVCELGDDPSVWRAHLLGELRQLIGASTCISYVHALPLDPTCFSPRGYVDVGADPQWQQYIANADINDNPITAAMVQLVGHSAVRSEDQLCSTGKWYSSVYFNQVVRPLHMDHEMASLAPLPGGRGFSALGFGRYLGDKPFGLRDRTLVHVVHTEIARLWHEQTRASDPANEIGARLSRRLRQTLDLLCTGLSEKQVAIRLGLSAHTVHDYVKELHRRFDVSATTELIARVQRVRRFRPVIESEPSC